jgi:hypothetical protein
MCFRDFRSKGERNPHPIYRGGEGGRGGDPQGRRRREGGGGGGLEGREREREKEREKKRGRRKGGYPAHCTDFQK